MRITCASFVALLLLLAPRASSAAGAEEVADEPVGITLELGYATSYLFRGVNVFGDEQLDANGLFAPAVTYLVPRTSLSIGYWGAFQLNGGNVGAKIANALGAEQDLWMNYDVALPKDLVLSIATTAFLYPMASEAATGASFPVFLEPRLGLAWNGPVTVALNVSYVLGIQDTAAIRGISYLYLNPKVSKVLALHPNVDLDLSASYGFKYFKAGNDGASSVHDLLLRAGVPIRPVGKLYVTPGVALAWTNLKGLAFSKEIAVYGFLNVGVAL